MRILKYISWCFLCMGWGLIVQSVSAQNISQTDPVDQRIVRLSLDLDPTPLNQNVEQLIVTSHTQYHLSIYAQNIPLAFGQSFEVKFDPNQIDIQRFELFASGEQNIMVANVETNPNASTAPEDVKSFMQKPLIETLSDGLVRVSTKMQIGTESDIFGYQGNGFMGNLVFQVVDDGSGEDIEIQVLNHKVAHAFLGTVETFPDTQIVQLNMSRTQTQQVRRLAQAQVQVLEQGEPLENVGVTFARSIAGRMANGFWEGGTDANGWAFVDVEGDSRYYSAVMTDSMGREIGRWHSIPLMAGETSVLRFEVGKSYERLDIQPLHKFAVTLDSVQTVVDSVVAGVYLPLKVTALMHRYENGVGKWVVDENYQGDEGRVSVRAMNFQKDAIHWRGNGVTDLESGQATLDAQWQNGQRVVEVMSTRVMDDFSVVVQAFGGQGQLDGLTVDAGDLRKYSVRALEHGIETSIVTGEFMVEVVPIDLWGNPTTKVDRRPGGTDSLCQSLRLLDSRIDSNDVLSTVNIHFGSNLGDAQILSGVQYVSLTGAQFEAIAPNRKGSGLIVSVRTAEVSGDSASSWLKNLSAKGGTPPLDFLPEEDDKLPIEPPGRPQNFIVQDYLGAGGAGDQGGYLMVGLPVSNDHDSLSHYQIHRELEVTTDVDGNGKVIVLDDPQKRWIPWVSLDPIDNGFDVVRAVIPVTDNLITRWAVAAEREDENGEMLSSEWTFAEDAVGAVDNIAPAAVLNVKGVFQDSAMHVSWDASVDDRLVGYVNFRGFAIPIDGVISYEVYRSLTFGESWTFVTQLPSGTTSYVDTLISVADANRVHYRVDVLDKDNRTVGISIALNGTKATLLTRERFMRAFGTKKDELYFVSEADLNGDGVIGFADFLLYLKMIR